MSNATEVERKTIGVAEAAKELGLSEKTLIGWASDGHLPLFVPPGRELGGSKRGPKGFLIWLADWEEFKRERTTTVKGTKKRGG